MPNETCYICKGFAGFESSPEGEACTKCGEWVCKKHTSYIGEDPYCSYCLDEND